MNEKESRIILFLILANLIVALWNRSEQKEAHQTYVLTPMVDLLPEGQKLSESEKEALEEELGIKSEARNIAGRYAHLGATLSLHDLLRGIAFLEQTDSALQSEQKENIQRRLEKLQSGHRELQALQRELTALEQSMAEDIQGLQEKLP